MYNESTALAVISNTVATATLPAITANRKGLLAALSLICATVEKRNTISILSNVMLTTGFGGPLELVGTDLDVEVRTTVQTSESWLDFQATLPAYQLRDLIKNSTAESVTITMLEPHVTEWVNDTDTDGKLIKRPISNPGRAELAFSDGGKATLHSLPPEDFPDLKGPDESTGERFSYSVKASEIVAGFGGVAHAISTEELRYYLNGIYLHYSPSEIHGVSGLVATTCNGHQLAHRSIPGLVPTGIPGVIVPRKTVLTLLKYLGKKPDGSVKVTVTTRKIRFSHGETVFTSKLIDGTFPDYARVIPRDRFNSVTINTKAFAAMVKQVSSMSLEKSRAVKLEFKSGRIVASVNNPDNGTSTASMAAVMPADYALTAGFNSAYLLSLCGAMAGDSFDFNMVDGGGPALITSPTDSRGLHVIMPMRV
jgi:DNA polymerase-3 subunit beta